LARVKLDQEALGLSSVLERMTHAHVKDCFREEDIVYFVVGTGDLGKAIGKGGIMIKKLQEKLNKRVKVIEYRSDVVGFVQNVIYPVKVSEIVVEGEIVFIRDDDRMKKGKIIGRSGSGLAFVNKVVKRYFDVDVKVE
jgi:transcription termination/antitermination protein NusA